MLVDLFCKKWGESLTWENRFMGGPHEASFLKLDCSKLKGIFQWQPRWNVETAIEKTVEWAKCYNSNGNVNSLMEMQINEFFKII